MNIKHIVALSGGKDSSAMAIRLKELYPKKDFQYVITPTGDELPEMIDHWNRLAELLGKKLTVISSGYSLKSLIKKFNALPNWRQRWCTRVLKIEPYAKYLSSVTPAISYVGLRADEPERDGGDYSKVWGVRMVFPMRKWGWTIKDVYEYLKEKEICIPKRTDCARCFFQRLQEWKDLSIEHPDIYEDAILDEKTIGRTYRSENKDAWPGALDKLRDEFNSGRQIRNRKDNFAEMKCRVCSK